MAEANTRTFLYAQLRAPGVGWRALSDRLASLWPAWPEAHVMGVFTVLFGMSNHDLVVLLSLPTDKDGPACLRSWLPADVTLVDCLPMLATVRPSSDAAHTRPGIYVFRIFNVAAEHVSEVASLSQTAWLNFEGDTAYTTEPVGLFRFADPQAAQGRMVLLTWYDNFTSWERSRAPHPAATANFRRRLALTQSVIAYPTRLVDTVAR